MATDFTKEPEKKKKKKKNVHKQNLKHPCPVSPGYPITRELEYDRDPVGMAPTVWILRAFPRGLVETHLGLMLYDWCCIH